MSWLISKTLMNSLCSQAQAVESLEDTYLDGEQSVPLNGNNIPQAYCAPDKMTGFSRLSRFGMTYKVLEENRGEELLTLYLEAFLAKTYQPQGGGLALTENEAECGEKWRGSFVKYDPDLFLWKTHQCSLLGDLDEFLETWPQWGLMRDGECWEQRTLEQSIRGTEFGSLQNKWATPTTMDKLPPKSAQALHREATQTRQGRSKPANLRDQVSNMKNWPTPVKSDHSARRPSKGWQGNSDLPSVVWTESGGRENPTMPPAQLNATWVEWLMGWPLGWTDLKPLEMDKSPSVPQPHGES